MLTSKNECRFQFRNWIIQGLRRHDEALRPLFRGNGFNGRDGVDTYDGKGGVDTVCTLHARVSWRGHSVVVAADHGPDFYTAVQSASKKLKLALRRMIDRTR